MAETPESPELNLNQQPSAPAPPPFHPVASSYQATAMPPQPGVAAPKSGGSSAVKIILIIVGVFVCLGILAAGVVGYGIWRVSRAVHNYSANGVTINTPGGAITSNPVKTYTADELGIDIYPGAQPTKGGLNMTLPTGSMLAANFVTSDSKDQVVAFYKGKVGSNAATMDTADGAYINWNKSTKDSVVISITQKSNQSDGKTQIHIVHTTNKSS